MRAKSTIWFLSSPHVATERRTGCHPPSFARRRRRDKNDRLARSDHVRTDRRTAVHRAADGGRHVQQVGGRRLRARGHLRRSYTTERIPVPGQQGGVHAHDSRCVHCSIACVGTCFDWFLPLGSVVVKGFQHPLLSFRTPPYPIESLERLYLVLNRR